MISVAACEIYQSISREEHDAVSAPWLLVSASACSFFPPITSRDWRYAACDRRVVGKHPHAICTYRRSAYNLSADIQRAARWIDKMSGSPKIVPNFSFIARQVRLCWHCRAGSGGRNARQRFVMVARQLEPNCRVNAFSSSS